MKPTLGSNCYLNFIATGAAAGMQRNRSSGAGFQFDTMVAMSPTKHHTGVCLKLTMLHVLIGITVVVLPVLASAGELVLGPKHFGKVKFGERIEVVERLLGQHAEPKLRVPECDFVTFRHFPNARFMVENGIISRADSKGPISTETKVKLGMTLGQAKLAEPVLEISPHHYADDGHYLALYTADKKHAILFEEFDGRVQEVRAGLASSVAYVEGCS